MQKFLRKTLTACLAVVLAAGSIVPVSGFAQEDDGSQTYDALPLASTVVGQADNGGIVRSQVAYVVDLTDNRILYSKNADVIRPIASISKLMTALIITTANLNMNEQIIITADDIDRVKKSSSRLSVGTILTRSELLHLALMSSENRAAHALGRTYPGGMDAFVREMNAKARQLGMTRTRFVEPTGLSPQNVASPRDLVRLMQAVHQQPLIREYTTSDKYQIVTSNGREQRYRNTNRLIRNSNWNIHISKTGYIREAGDCLVMMTEMDNRPVAVVLLNADGGLTRFADAVRVRHMVQQDYPTLL
ncbi:D-alanyl-D-alanine endopeptidase (penicillin-binding protein 7) [Advenella incenata]|jgi:D-alanyl-D-alanine endopeptidase (penicillin-binding protein 7)|uniref:D-alanyl-D-alanine endopeptidase (Penicillin-binding protein 7) n=1 Tax=Advenella incenata TaxID=267800 RepID=A0A4Q7VUS7_9BURK|nr:D-alanyl-D-alanine endopeptidase [Advenella incenata]RZU00402.1 D-alanyl-D-alanine endopeptidase (penicillin-binding protein 7) [Advenella incenata]